MTAPTHAERLWVVLDLASLWGAILAPTDETDATQYFDYPILGLFKHGMFRQLDALQRMDGSWDTRTN